MVKVLDSQCRVPEYKTIGVAPGSTHLFNLLRLIQMSIGNSWGLSPRSGSVALRQLNPMHKKGVIIKFMLKPYHIV